MLSLCLRVGQGPGAGPGAGRAPPPSPAHQHLGHGPPSASRAAEAAGRPPGGALGWGQGGGSTPGLGKLPQEPSSSRDSPGGVRLWVQEALQWVRDQR